VRIDTPPTHADYPFRFAHFHHFADGSVLVTEEGERGHGDNASISFAHWFASTAEWEEYVVDHTRHPDQNSDEVMAVRNRWLRNKAGRMRKLSEEEWAERMKRWKAKQAAEAEGMTLFPATDPTSEGITPVDGAAPPPSPPED
jgi:hypothetical protein